MTLFQRINTMLEERGIMKKTLAEYMGVGSSTFHTWSSANIDTIPSEYIPSIARFFNITCDELLTGETQIVPHEDERRLLEIYRTLDWSSKQMVLAKLVEEDRYLKEHKNGAR